MPRGFKRDETKTAEAKNTGLYCLDRRSFISLPKIIKGECTEPKPHVILFGKDKAPIRAEIFRRNREANRTRDGAPNRCWKCHKQVLEFAPYPFDLDQGHWHHVRHKAGERCDCPENGVVSCVDCHRKEHR